MNGPAHRQTERVFAVRTPWLGVMVWLFAAGAHAGDWPCWRGPNHDGISTEKGWRDQWPRAGPTIAWKESVGTGFSSVTVSQGRLCTMGHRDGKDTVVCLDAATGQRLWGHSYEAALGDVLFEGGPTATPTFHEGAVYTLSRWGDLFCFDAASGKVRWSRNIAREESVRLPSWGFAGSPLVQDDLLVLNVGEAGMALDRNTGKLVWKSADKEAGYSSPLPFRRAGEWQVLLSSGDAYVAANLKTGKEVWRIRWLTRYGVNAADPILSGDQLLISTGYNKGASFWKLGGGEPVEVWRNKNLRSQINSGVRIGPHVYGIDGDTNLKAGLRCVDLATGEVRWGFDEVGAGSVTAGDGKLIVLSDRGELLVGPASPDRFAPSARARVLEGKCWTVPVLANGRVYCRNAAGDLVCVDLRPAGAGKGSKD